MSRMHWTLPMTQHRVARERLVFTFTVSRTEHSSLVLSRHKGLFCLFLARSTHLHPRQRTTPGQSTGIGHSQPIDHWNWLQLIWSTLASACTIIQFMKNYRQKRRRFDLQRAAFILPNLFTLSSIFCGFYAAVTATAMVPGQERETLYRACVAGSLRHDI